MITQAQIQDVVDKIVQGYQPEKIILFGSYAYGTPTEDSDLDLLIIKDTEEKMRARKNKVRQYIWHTTIPVDIWIYNMTEFTKEDDWGTGFFAEIKQGGKTLYEKRR